MFTTQSQCQRPGMFTTQSHYGAHFGECVSIIDDFLFSQNVLPGSHPHVKETQTPDARACVEGGGKWRGGGEEPC